MPDAGNPFAQWLDATLQTRGLSQAQVARAVGVADAQVSRWRRGQVTPSVRYLQRLADTFGVPRASLDSMAGYPTVQSGTDWGEPFDPEREAEIQAYQARFRRLLEQTVPPSLWRTYAEACEALAGELSSSFEQALIRVVEMEGGAALAVDMDKADRGIGFHTKSHRRDAGTGR